MVHDKIFFTAAKNQLMCIKFLIFLNISSCKKLNRNGKKIDPFQIFKIKNILTPRNLQKQGTAGFKWINQMLWCFILV